MVHVLLVEDSDYDVRKCLRLFQTLGIENFRVVNRADQALEYMESIVEGTVEAPTMIVLDLLLGNGSGFEVLRFWKATPQLSNIPVIVWTGVATQTEQEMCKMFGVSANVMKSEGETALAAALSKIQGGSGHPTAGSRPQ